MLVIESWETNLRRGNRFLVGCDTCWREHLKLLLEHFITSGYFILEGMTQSILRQEHLKAEKAFPN